MVPTSRTDLNGVSLVEAMSGYVRSGQASPDLIHAQSLVGSHHLRLICICLLSWLKSRARVPKMTEMKVRESGSAADSLVTLIDTSGFFSSIFAREGDVVRLDCSLGQFEIDEIIATADRLYQPPRFITAKREIPGGRVEQDQDED